MVLVTVADSSFVIDGIGSASLIFCKLSASSMAGNWPIFSVSLLEKPTGTASAIMLHSS